MLPPAHVSHRSPRRLRIKVPSRKGDTGYFALVQGRLAGHPEVESVAVNPLTGSVLLLGAAAPRAIAELGRSGSLFELAAPRRGRDSAANLVAASFNRLDGRIKSATGQDLDLASVVWLSLVAAGIYQISRGNFVAPAWYTAFWYATQIFLTTHPGIARREHEDVRETMEALIG